mmetsp:Transcript_28886/g.67819  ORF Transcript_28886/g.67819 Transcript_28886/m.67819 type:complete len:662 (+) Transcript_28886:315-2300(+)
MQLSVALGGPNEIDPLEVAVRDSLLELDSVTTATRDHALIMSERFVDDLCVNLELDLMGPDSKTAKLGNATRCLREHSIILSTREDSDESSDEEDEDNEDGEDDEDDDSNHSVWLSSSESSKSSGIVSHGTFELEPFECQINLDVDDGGYEKPSIEVEKRTIAKLDRVLALAAQPSLVDRLVDETVSTGGSENDDDLSTKHEVSSDQKVVAIEMFAERKSTKKSIVQPTTDQAIRFRTRSKSAFRGFKKAIASAAAKTSSYVSHKKSSDSRNSISEKNLSKTTTKTTKTKKVPVKISKPKDTESSDENKMRISSTSRRNVKNIVQGIVASATIVEETPFDCADCSSVEVTETQSVVFETMETLSVESTGSKSADSPEDRSPTDQCSTGQEASLPAKISSETTDSQPQELPVNSGLEDSDSLQDELMPTKSSEITSANSPGELFSGSTSVQPDAPEQVLQRGISIESDTALEVVLNSIEVTANPLIISSKGSEDHPDDEPDTTDKQGILKDLRERIHIARVSSIEKMRALANTEFDAKMQDILNHRKALYLWSVSILNENERSGKGRSVAWDSGDVEASIASALTTAWSSYRSGDAARQSFDSDIEVEVVMEKAGNPIEEQRNGRVSQRKGAVGLLKSMRSLKRRNNKSRNRNEKTDSEPTK